VQEAAKISKAVARFDTDGLDQEIDAAAGIRRVVKTPNYHHHSQIPMRGPQSVKAQPHSGARLGRAISSLTSARVRYTVRCASRRGLAKPLARYGAL